MTKLDITYMAYSRVHYDTFDYETPIGEIHDKLRQRCQTYHITSVSYQNASDNFPIKKTKSKFSFLKLLTSKK
jgi:hypothetical protein